MRLVRPMAPSVVQSRALQWRCWCMCGVVAPIVSLLSARLPAVVTWGRLLPDVVASATSHTAAVGENWERCEIDQFSGCGRISSDLARILSGSVIYPARALQWF